MFHSLLAARKAIFLTRAWDTGAVWRKGAVGSRLLFVSETPGSYFTGYAVGFSYPNILAAGITRVTGVILREELGKISVSFGTESGQERQNGYWGYWSKTEKSNTSTPWYFKLSRLGKSYQTESNTRKTYIKFPNDCIYIF